MEEIKTKIIATIGPATLEPTVFANLIASGVDYIRINTSYGDESQYDSILINVEKTKKVRDVKVMLDIKNLSLLGYAKKNNISIVALSFAEDTQKIDAIRSTISNAHVISKIESKEGVNNFDEILHASDGIMIARGDLAKAETLEKVPPLQKDLTYKTLAEGKFLIAATEMLLSMVENLEPTRAEVSDVANAVFDNCSAVMLSEETAIGKHPVETVAMMRKIIVEAEKWKYKSGKL
ncbi:MAG TPA: pyruvate kinase [Candidatus Eisenbacteria bacterium]|nr:pyruvate kinase [Candidatus Eisenbacteria bacterium]